MSTAVAADSTDPSKRDFSNPMYEAMGDMESQVRAQADTLGLLKNEPDKMCQFAWDLY